MTSSWTNDYQNETITPINQLSTKPAETNPGHSVEEWMLIGVKLTIGVFGSIGNLIVCLFVSRMKSQKVKFLIRSQSTIDLCASILIVADTITAEIQTEPSPPHKHPVLGQLYCTFYTYQLLLFGLFASSSYNLVAISVERYITVFHPFWYRIHFSQKKTYLLGAIAWVLGPVAQTIYSLHSGRYMDGKCKWVYVSTLERRNLAIFLFSWDFLIPCILMGFCFTRIAIRLRKYDSNSMLQYKHTGSSALSAISRTVSGKEVSSATDTKIAHDGISTGPVSSGVSFDDSKEQIKRKTTEQSRSQKVTRTFIFVFLAYVCCWSTNQILFLQYNTGGYRHFGTPEYHFANSMATLNCAINPFIYVLHLKQYRKDIKSFFRA